MKKILTSKMGFFVLAVLLLWAKTYVTYIIEFNLDIKNGIQSFLLFLNPLSSLLFFLGIALFAKGRKSGVYVIIIEGFLSFLLYANVVYYRFNNDFITLPTLTQTSNFGSLGGSILNLMEWYDVFYMLDIIILITVFLSTKVNWSKRRLPVYVPAAMMVFAVGVFSVNLGLAEKDRPQLLERTFDRNYIVKYLGAYNFTIYDAYQSMKTSTQRVLADKSDIVDVEEYTRSKRVKPNPKYFGAGEGKNIIKIHLESFQSFLIGYRLHGEEVTPFLNSLAFDKDKNFTYFDNFFHQTEQGKTSDAEFILDNSLYGLPQGSAFVVKGTNTYQALPAILDQQQGYKSYVFHGDGKSFWNRDEIYKYLGIEQYFYSKYFDMSEDNVINYGLKDKPFFKESMPYLKTIHQPFYAHMITLTNHHPYYIDDGEETIAPAETGDSSVDRYFQTARYLDEALEQFFDDLKEAGLYKDSIIMLYGDHYGISDNHNRAMKELLGEEITPLKSANLQRVPFFIRVPGVESEGINHTYAGEIDVMPTLLDIMGIDTKDYIMFGSDMLSDEHKGVVPFRNGDFMTSEYDYVAGTFYDHDTEEKVAQPSEDMLATKESVMTELQLSDDVLYGDLLRFYTPNNEWEPIDPSDYFYSDWVMPRSYYNGAVPKPNFVD